MVYSIAKSQNFLQVFEDIADKYGPTATFFEQQWEQKEHVQDSSPLLVMVYDFDRGHGNIDISAVGDAASTSKMGIGRSSGFLDDM